MKTYELAYPLRQSLGSLAIRCLICGMISYHPEDVRHRYCANCHRFHEDQLPAHDGSGVNRV
jgi:hypothetical protein